MNKHSISLILTALGMSTCALMSCSSDEQFVMVDNDIYKNGVEAGVFDGIYSFNVASTAGWQASLPDDCNWAALLRGEGDSNSAATVVVDANHTGLDRSALITLTSGNEKLSVKLNQTASFDGETPENDAEFLKLAGKKYLGFGCNLLEFINDPKANPLTYRSCNVINNAAIAQLMKDKPIKYNNLANTTEIDEIDYDAIKLDTVVNKKDSLGVSIDIQVAYGLMKFGLSGSYHGKEDFKSDVLHIKTGANYPTLEASVNYAEVMSCYNQWVDDSKPEGDYRQYMISQSFAEYREGLRAACNEGKATQQEIDQIVNSLIRDYGTGVVTHSTLGGLIALELETGKIEQNENYDLDSAKITADITAGMFKLKGELKAAYINHATNDFNHSRYITKIVGGDRKKYRDLLSLLESCTYDTKLSDGIIDWAESIVNADDRSNTAELLSTEIVPIWALFSDTKSIAAIKDYLRKQYSGTTFVNEYVK